jgi:hypothetical protein
VALSLVGSGAVTSKKPKLLAAGHADNFGTPASALDPLVPYLKKEWTIWEPAVGKGNLRNALNNAGHSVVSSGHEEGFLNMRPELFDCIVTNPPYSIKSAFLARCYDLRKPFALLMPITTFDSQERRRLFHENGVQVIFPASRVNYETPNHAARAAVGKKSSAWFYSCWFCWGLDLPGPMVFTGFDNERSLMSVA